MVALPLRFFLPVTGICQILQPNRPHVPGLKQVAVGSFEDVQLLLAAGNERRGASRQVCRPGSHSVFTLRLTQGVGSSAKTSRMSLVDLAGAGAGNRAGAEPHNAGDISLAKLELVVRGLASRRSAGAGDGSTLHCDSALTCLLKGCFGGDCKTVVVATVSPAKGCFSESLATLQFTHIARQVQNRAVVNEDASVTLKKLKTELAMLKTQARKSHKAGDAGMDVHIPPSVPEMLPASADLSLLERAWFCFHF